MSRKEAVLTLPMGTALLMLLVLATGADLTPGEPSLPEAVVYRQEGRRLQQEGKLREALSAFDKALLINPSYAEAYNDAGVMLESLGRADQAEWAYRKALEYRPDFSAPYSNLALLYEEAGRLKEAAEQWRARIRLGPVDDPWVAKARERLAQVNLPGPDQAVALAGKAAVTASQKEEEVKRLIEVGRAHLEAGRWEQAAESFERALERDPKNRLADRLLDSAQAKEQAAERHRQREMDRARERVMEEARRETRLMDKKEREQARAEAERTRAEADRSRRMEAALQAQARERAELERRARLREEQLKEGRAKAQAAQEQIRAARIKAQTAQQARQAEEARRRAIEEARRRAEQARQRAEVARQAAAAQVPTPPAVPSQTQPPVQPESAMAQDARRIAQELAQQRGRVRRKSAQELYQKGVAAMRKGEYEQAAEYFQQILTLEPDNREAQKALERARVAQAKAKKRP